MTAPAHILVVQPPGEERARLRHVLEEGGDRVWVVDDAAAAWQWWESGGRVEVVLAAHCPPRVDGPHFLEQLRERPEGEGVSVIMLAEAGRWESLRDGALWPADEWLARAEDPVALRRAVRRQVVRARQWRQALQRRHRALLACLPHELRTPLNGVLGCAEIMADMTSGPPEGEGGDGGELIGLLRESGERLRAVLDTVDLWLEVNCPAQVGRAVSTNGTDWRPLLGQGVKGVLARRQREADLRLDLQPQPLPVAGEDLARVVGLLADNAAKFSAAGHPIVLQGAREGEGYALRVLDRGPGMTAEQCAQVEAFAQFERRQRQQDGIGLGLATARSWVRQTGGQLRLRPRAGGGLEAGLWWRAAALPKPPAVLVAGGLA
jgi:two-component system, sensor histidine kinase and response regulator